MLMSLHLMLNDVGREVLTGSAGCGIQRQWDYISGVLVGGRVPIFMSWLNGGNC